MTVPYSLQGMVHAHIGYGAMTARLADALSSRVELRDDARSVVFGLMPNQVKGWLAGQRAACLTMWETDRPPALFGRLLPFFDKVLVPSTFCADLFAGMSREIGVVPLGVDRDVWRPGKVPSGPFTFITGGSSWPRKGIQQVMDAFKAADLPDARLLVKLPDYVAEMPDSITVPDGVTVIQERLPLDAEVALYQSADCFVSGSRGEGFGMIPLQNVAVGNLVIAPGHTGHGDFADLFDYNLSWTKQPAELKNWPDTGNWFVPDFDEMVDAMRDAFQRGRLHWASRQKRWRSTAAWTWDAAADRLLEVFPPSGTVDSSHLVRLEPPASVLALRRVEADIGEYRIRAVQGEVFDVPASTVTQLVESGLVAEL